jgi:hypothetical protein
MVIFVRARGAFFDSRLVMIPAGAGSGKFSAVEGDS